MSDPLSRGGAGAAASLAEASWTCPACERDGDATGHLDAGGGLRPGHGCRACERDGHTGGHRDASGRLGPGHTNNAAGRPKGRLNDTTIAARQRLRAGADEAAQAVLEGLRSANGWERLAAARVVLESLPPDGAPDSSWLKHATDEELQWLSRLVKRCEARRGREEHAPEPGDDAADVEPEPLPADRDRDEFSLRSLPAPRRPGPAAHEEHEDDR